MSIHGNKQVIECVAYYFSVLSLNKKMFIIINDKTKVITLCKSTLFDSHSYITISHRAWMVVMAVKEI